MICARFREGKSGGPGAVREVARVGRVQEQVRVLGGAAPGDERGHRC